MSGHPLPSAKPRNRDTVFMMARVTEAPDDAPVRYVVRNLSATGACIAEPTGLEKFKRLVVSIGRLDHVEAEVAWARGGFAGIKFLHPIDVVQARKHRTAIGPAQAGWISDLRRPHQRIHG